MAHCLLWTIVLIYWQDTENRTQKQSQKWNYITWTLFYLLFCEAVDLLAARKSSCSLRFLYMCSKILKVKSWQKHNMNKECIEKIWVVGKCFEDILKSTCVMNMHGKILKKERKNTKKQRNKKNQNVAIVYSTFHKGARPAHFHITQTKSLFNWCLYMIQLSLLWLWCH